MIHHSLTEDSETVSWPAIEKYHIQTQGWNDIGYHAGVELVTNNKELEGYQYQGLIGRGVNQLAAACPQGDMNKVALHVCCVGNYDLKPPPLELLRILLKRFLLPWSSEYGIPVENWVGHRDYNPHKTCPGTQFDLGVLRNMGR
jgi:hypothetical protein